MHPHTPAMDKVNMVFSSLDSEEGCILVKNSTRLEPLKIKIPDSNG